MTDPPRTPELPTGAQPPGLPTYCRACGGRIDARAAICPACGVAQAPAVLAAAGGLLFPPAPKSEGVAVMLSLIWPGAGHLYARDEGRGVLFTVISGVCLLLSLTIVGLVISVPVWLGCLIFTLIDVGRAVRVHNDAQTTPR